LLRLNVLNWLTIDLDQTTSLLCESAGRGCLFPNKDKRAKLEEVKKYCFHSRLSLTENNMDA